MAQKQMIFAVNSYNTASKACMAEYFICILRNIANTHFLLIVEIDNYLF